MKLSLLLVSAPLLALPCGPARLQFRPAEDTAVEKTFTVRMELEFDELTSVMNGQEVPQSYLPDMDIRHDHESRTVVVDRYLSVADGRPLRLKRTYDEIADSMAYEFRMAPNVEESSQSDGESELEGATVLFDWNAEGDAYAVSFEEQVAGEELLDGLLEDMDLRALLPAGEVEEGDTWEIDALTFAPLMSPGGNLGIVHQNDDGEYARILADREASDLVGSVKLRFVRIDDEEGRRLAVIAVEGELESQIEKPTTLDHIPVVDGTATEQTTTTFELDGELHWDLAAGRAHSLALSCPVDITAETVKDDGQPGPSFASTLTLTGTWTLEVAARPH